MIVVVIITACTRKLDPETSCNFVQNSDLRRVSWDDRTPVKLYVHQSMPLDKYPEMKAIIQEAVQAWNQVAGRELIRIEAYGVGGSKTPVKDGYSTLYWLTDWDTDPKTGAPTKQNEQARTTIFWSGSEIYEADIKVNARDHTFYVGHEETFSGVDFKSLIIHELGHALGLAHVSGQTSVMNVSLNSGTDRRTITKLDADSIRCEY